MATNSIEKYVTILQNQLDEMVTHKATSGWMENNAIQVNYEGGNSVEIGEISTTGLKDYDRDAGFTTGSVSLNFKKHTMTQDREQSFHIDRMDNAETNFLLNASAVMKDFQERHVIPEIDAYRYSALATKAIGKGQTLSGYSPIVGDVFTKLLDDLGVIEDLYGENANIVITMPGKVRRILEMSDQFQRNVSLIDFTQGKVSTKVKAINEHAIITAPANLLKTKYLFRDGKTSGQETGGFAPDAAALDINWLITVQTAPLAISRTEKLRVFAPDINQKADAWKIDFRKYHDLWVKNSALTGIFVNTAPKG